MMGILAMLKKFKHSKTDKTKALILQALEILGQAGIPLNQNDRALEKMAMVFLAVGDVNKPSDWSNIKGRSSGRSMGTRDIIGYLNEHFNENISMGSYDDIRRKDLLLPVASGIIVPTNPNAARNDPSRGYAVDDDFVQVARQFPDGDWKDKLSEFLSVRGKLEDRLVGKRELPHVPVTTPKGQGYTLSPGKHNILQKSIIEEFLPRFAPGCELLYLGDTANKSLLIEKERLNQLNFFELEHGELPDIIAYLAEKNWLFLIEAVHSAGPMSPIRVEKLKKLASECTAGMIFVTAFETKNDFKKWIPQLAWETEVWIASDPDHLIHFDGEKFLGPYSG